MSLYNGTGQAALDGLPDDKDVDRLTAAQQKRERKQKKREENNEKSKRNSKRQRRYPGL